MSQAAERNNLDQAEVVASFLGPRLPLILRRFALEWPAVQKWTPTCLAIQLGDVQVPVQDSSVDVAERPAALTRRMVCQSRRRTSWTASSQGTKRQSASSSLATSCSSRRDGGTRWNRSPPASRYRAIGANSRTGRLSSRVTFSINQKSQREYLAFCRISNSQWRTPTGLVAAGGSA